LAEPWTIPWFVKNNNELVVIIIEALHEFFRLSELLKQLPTDDWDAWGKTQFSIAELLDCLQMVALEAGAATVMAAEVSSDRVDEFKGNRLSKNSWAVVGFSYYIEFTVPHDSRCYATTIDHWFDPSRLTRYRKVGQG
jgi:hypothetical protein